MLRKFLSRVKLDTPSAVETTPVSRLDAFAQLQAENTVLKQEARRFANIINTSLNPIWQRDLDLKIVFCNLAFTEVAEETSEAVLAVGDMELYRGHRTLAQKALETGQEQFERRHIIVGGERRLYMIREVPLKGEGVIGYAMHISELERAQEEIQRHVSALRDLLESSTSAMAIYGRDSKLKFYNFAFVNLWKMDESWLNTEPNYGEILEVMREKRKLPEQSNFKAFKEAQTRLFTTLIEPSEEFFYLPDGRTLRVIAIPHALGGILFAYEDVTDRLALERSYNTLIAVQRETLDHLHEGIAVFGENGRLTLCNPIFNKLWSIDSEFTATEPHIREVFARARDLFVTDDWARYLDSLVSRFQQRRYLSLRFERANGTVVDCSAVPLPDGATLLSFTDVTDSTLVERSLRDRAQALETADRMKTEFLANMSYELRSPLTSISGFSEMLTHEYAGPLNASQKDYVSGIFQSSQHLASLIGDIIDLATIEAGFLKLEVKPFNIRDMIDAVLALLRTRLELQDVMIDVSVSPEVVTLEADEMRVKQILINLLSNAVRVTKSKGHIRVLVDIYQHRGTRISVRDDGPGLDEQRRDTLFDPFFRGSHVSGTDSVLSLSLVKRFMELHGGEIHVESEPGKGTAICCIFVGAMPTP
ncbi:MAG: PAS-domain containing protein [Rickettsiales bacterium]|nr:PAS-domain containing protein [Rickettsiales bacterium]